MKYGYTLLYVNDVSETVDFYQRAFSLKLKFVHEQQGYAEMETGETTLAFVGESFVQEQEGGVKFKPNRRDELFPGLHITFVTDDINSAFETAIKEGAKSISAPTRKPWGQDAAYVADNNGILVEICTPIEACPSQQ